MSVPRAADRGSYANRRTSEPVRRRAVRAALLLLFVIIATLSSHRYWEFAEAAARRAQDNNFYKNLAIMGGLVFAFVTAGGRFSIDRLLARK